MAITYMEHTVTDGHPSSCLVKATLVNVSFDLGTNALSMMNQYPSSWAPWIKSKLTSITKIDNGSS